MQKQQKTHWLKRLLNWFFYPFLVVPAAWKAIVPRKATEEELKAFEELTPGQRWQKANEKQRWTAERLASERIWSCRMAYALLFCSWMIFVGTGFAFKYMTFFQIVGALGYGLAAFLFFAKKSMVVYAIDNRKIITLNDWPLMPFVWIPIY